VRRALPLLLVLLAGCSDGEPRGSAPATTAPATTPPATPPPSTGTPAVTRTAWPPPSIRMTDVTFGEFRTPSGNIACGVGGEGAHCEIREYTWRLPPKPEECEYDWVAGAGVDLNGIQIGQCRSDTVLGATRVLEYGTGLRAGDFACISEQAGVTCRDEGDGGFFLSRSAAREIPYSG
jgi:hypothetical protein